MERRLAAIMFADIVGYTALMAADEVRGLRARERHRALVRPLVERYHGDAIEARGDESLAVFPTALDAVNCALAIEEALAGDGELRLHVGIHVGDCVVEHGEVSGDAVNIAARIRSFAESGVCVSAEVYHSVRNQPNVEATLLGEHELKNVGRPIALYAVRGAAAQPRTTAERPAARSAIRSIAVLPLENLSGDPSQEYFADGMTETLIADLGKLRSLRVISRTSVMRYKGARKPLPEIARELAVDALLEGTVIRDGDRVRITAQLIDGRTDHHLWADRYDRELRGILELQSDVARAVAREVELELSPREDARPALPRRVEPAAHDALLKGLYQLRLFSAVSVRSAIASFERAIEIDPGYALAHAVLGRGWYSLVGQTALPIVEGMPRAESEALRALELDPALAEAHAVLGAVAFNFHWDWPAAERRLRRALELNASLPWAHTTRGFVLVTSGRSEEAIAEGLRAVELDPFDLPRRGALANLYRLARRYDDALAFARQVIDTDPMHVRGQLEFAWVCERLGRFEESIAAYERCGMVSAEEGVGLRAALSRGGAQGFWRELLRLDRSLPAARHYFAAGFHALLGERDEAIAALERAYAAREGVLVSLRVDERFDSLRDDPRFEALVRRIGIPS
ncbi:MAG TPA: adenylate/guanylate cyclase domain-containing protein [Myxococcota bacterium]|nr:adenylate/guanylate cyclase domain-containing protein [Myxococcota bacterium]